MSESSNPTTQPGQPRFGIHRIYLKDASFEVPMGYQIFSKPVQPEIHQHIDFKHLKIEDHLYEVCLRLTITAKVVEEGQEKAAFIVEAEQAGIFLVDMPTPELLANQLETVCPGVLYPYLREVVDSMTMRGTFPRVMLQPLMIPRKKQPEKSSDLPDAS